MPTFIDKLKAKLSGKKAQKELKKEEKKQEGGGGEVHILPVPGNTNEPPETGGGLNSNPADAVLKGPGPVIPTPEMANALGEPKTREELHARAAALNAEP